MSQSKHNSSIVLKILLTIQTIVVICYTLYTVKNEGWGLFNIFLNNITTVNWNGQFNLDFTCYLLLSGLWIMWRDLYTPRSIVTGLIAMVMGIIVFAPYIFYLQIKEKGDLKRVLVGLR